MLVMRKLKAIAWWCHAAWCGVDEPAPMTLMGLIQLLESQGPVLAAGRLTPTQEFFWLTPAELTELCARMDEAVRCGGQLNVTSRVIAASLPDSLGHLLPEPWVEPERARIPVPFAGLVRRIQGQSGRSHGPDSAAQLVAD
jgi:hypothetical protein